MPRYEFDPSKASATIEILPKDEYVFIVGEPRTFFGKNQKGADSYGIRYPLTVAEGPKEGKKAFMSCYQQNEGAQAMGKRFVMATLGYEVTSENEKRFDSDFAGQDWGYDTDTGACGDVWRSLTGKRVIGVYDVKMREDNGEPQQEQKAWRPFGT